MSFVQRSLRSLGQTHRTLLSTAAPATPAAARTTQRSFVVVNPAINNNPAYNFKAVLPLDFQLSDELRALLTSSGYGAIIDPLERLYADQLSNDAELTHWVLPRSDCSRLWAFIYGERLVNAQTQLNGLSAENEFVRNYLQSQIAELSLKMARYYPDLDWKAQVSAVMTSEAEHESRVAAGLDFASCYNESLCQTLFDNAENENEQLGNGGTYISCFANNNFVVFDDATDSLNDFLPESLESELIQYYEFLWYHNNHNVNADRYFGELSRIEAIVSPAMDALSKDFRNNFSLFMFESFSKCQSGDIEFIIDVVESSFAPNSIVADNSGVAKAQIVSESLAMLDISTEGQSTGAMAKLLSQLFFGNRDAHDTRDTQEALMNLSFAELSAVLQSVDHERLRLIHKALQLQTSLKHSSFTRVLFSCVLSKYPQWFSQFMARTDHIAGLENANSGFFASVVEQLSDYYSSQEALCSKMKQLSSAMNKEIGVDLSQAYYSKFDGKERDCFVVRALKKSGAEHANGIVSQIKYGAYANYIGKYGDRIPWYKLLHYLINPSRNGYTGALQKSVAFEYANNTSSAHDLLFGNVVEMLRHRGVLTSDTLVSAKSDLMQAPTIVEPLEELRSAAQRFDQSRQLLEDTLCSVKLSFEEYDFQHIRDTYNPLDIHLSQFRYLSPK